VDDLVIDGTNDYSIPIFFAFESPMVLSVHLLTDSSTIGDQDRLDSDGDTSMRSSFRDSVIMDAALSKRFALHQGIRYIQSRVSSTEHTRVNLRILMLRTRVCFGGSERSYDVRKKPRMQIVKYSHDLTAHPILTDSEYLLMQIIDSV